MYRPDLGVYLAIISARRPHEVPRLSKIVGPATWYVAEGEGDPYFFVGAPAVQEAGALCAARNAALDAAFRQGHPCLQLSDDLRTVKQAVRLGDGRTYAKDIRFEAAVQTLRQRLAEYPTYRLGGVAPTASTLNYNASRPTSFNAFVVGDMILVEPTDLRFDEAFALKEDYDYTCQHLSRYGGIVRCNDLLVTFQHGTNPGGAVAYRTAQREQDAILRLNRKWPDAFLPNPKRPNEVLLRWKEEVPCSS